MIIVICDVCKKQLTAQEIQYCNEMVGYGHFCSKHLPKQEKVSYVKKYDKWNGFPFNTGNPDPRWPVFHESHTGGKNWWQE